MIENGFFKSLFCPGVPEALLRAEVGIRLLIWATQTYGDHSLAVQQHQNGRFLWGQGGNQRSPQGQGT